VGVHHPATAHDESPSEPTLIDLHHPLASIEESVKEPGNWPDIPRAKEVDVRVPPPFCEVHHALESSLEGCAGHRSLATHQEAVLPEHPRPCWRSGRSARNPRRTFHHASASVGTNSAVVAESTRCASFDVPLDAGQVAPRSHGLDAASDRSGDPCRPVVWPGEGDYLSRDRVVGSS
jgi:hypothetical protein